jgi:hypothetical protein
MARRTTERSFDELARGLAEGSISRRRALKLFAGSAIAALIPSRALAGGHGKPEKCKEGPMHLPQASWEPQQSADTVHPQESA